MLIPVARVRWQALLEGVNRGDVSSVQLALQQGASLHYRRDWDGSTAVHVAAEGGRSALLSVLLEKGADAGAENSEDETGMTLAHAAGQAGCVAVLEHWGQTLPEEEMERGRVLETSLQLLKGGGSDPQGGFLCVSTAVMLYGVVLDSEGLSSLFVASWSHSFEWGPVWTACNLTELDLVGEWWSQSRASAPCPRCGGVLWESHLVPFVPQGGGGAVSGCDVL